MSAAPVPVPCDDGERKFWLMLRRALLLAVKAIELRYGNESTKERAA